MKNNIKENIVAITIVVILICLSLIIFISKGKREFRHSSPRSLKEINNQMIIDESIKDYNFLNKTIVV